MPFDVSIDVLKKQVTLETYRSRGPGGQRKNKVETAVRLKHLPSGITVTASEHRHQSQNLSLAYKRLQKQLMRLNRPKKKRLPTPMPLKAKEIRIKEKKIGSAKKRLRKSPLADRIQTD